MKGGGVLIVSCRPFADYRALVLQPGWRSPRAPPRADHPRRGESPSCIRLEMPGQKGCAVGRPASIRTTPPRSAAAP